MIRRISSILSFFVLIMQAYAPTYPFPRDEHWIFMLINLKDNTVLAHKRVSLVEAEKAAAQNMKEFVAAEGEDAEKLLKDHGQDISFQFLAPFAGNHELLLVGMCDSWIGADAAVKVQIVCTEATRAQKEGRSGRASKPKQLERSEESEIMVEGDSDTNSDDESMKDEDEGEWDSDEYGTEESGSDTEGEEQDEKSKDD